MIKILIVDDDKDLVKVLKANLLFENYDVITAENGFEANKAIKETNPDLILLDLNLPDVDGIQICHKLRENNNDIPVIMLSARDSVSDKILGLECGADDYIVKPFNFLELNARIKGCLRRCKPKNNEMNKKIIKYGNLRIYPEKHEIYYGDEKIDFTKTEYKLFLYLFENRDRICSRKEIRRTLWKDKEIYNWSRTIDIHINHIRKKLSDDMLIKTVQGIGYIFE